MVFKKDLISIKPVLINSLQIKLQEQTIYFIKVRIT